MISYARKEYEFVVQHMAMGLFWAAFGYLTDRAP